MGFQLHKDILCKITVEFEIVDSVPEAFWCGMVEMYILSVLMMRSGEANNHQVIIVMKKIRKTFLYTYAIAYFFNNK